MKSWLKFAIAAASSLALILPGLPPQVSTPAEAAASLQTTHAFLCAPQPAVSAPGPRSVVNTSSTSLTRYTLNTDGCAVFAAADIGFFLSQGFYYGPNTFTLTQTGITANTTATTSTIVLPPYGMVLAITLQETAGNAITGGVDVGDAGSATNYVSAAALGANANVSATVVNRLPASGTGVPSGDTILVVCHTACNSGSINISVLYSYY